MKAKMPVTTPAKPIPGVKKGGAAPMKKGGKKC